MATWYYRVPLWFRDRLVEVEAPDLYFDERNCSIKILKGKPLNLEDEKTVGALLKAAERVYETRKRYNLSCSTPGISGGCGFSIEVDLMKAHIPINRKE